MQANNKDIAVRKYTLPHEALKMSDDNRRKLSINIAKSLGRILGG